jgi:hypothetical protein
MPRYTVTVQVHPDVRHEHPTAEEMNWRGKAPNEDAAMNIAEKSYRDRYPDAGKLHMRVARRRLRL